MSSEEQYKHIEDKIKEAANASDHTFTEASWKKMEALLDQKKDKRRPFFWIFSILLLGVLVLGGGIIYQSININKLSQNTVKQIDNKSSYEQITPSLNGAGDIITAKQPALSEKNADNSNIVAATDNTNKDVDLTAGADNSPVKENTYKPKKIKQDPVADFSPIVKSISKNTSFKKRGVTVSAADENYSAVNKNVYKDKAKFGLKITSPELENDMDKGENKTAANTDTNSADAKTLKTDSATSDLTKNKAADTPDTTAKKTNPVTKSEKKKDKKKISSGFYVLAAAGAEATSTKLLSYKNSTISPVYGAGLGYQFNRRFSVQTGFYAGAKKYVAGPNDYNVKAGSYLSTVKIIKVDANCMVYEVPVTLQYNWLIKPKTNYYAAVGLSSYIMKKEKYNYTFERYNTQYSYPYDYTKNTHLLASLQLSLGIEKQIGRKLFIQAAPIVNIPLQGVGEGSVKIFTTGLHVGLKYFPFKH